MSVTLFRNRLYGRNSKDEVIRVGANPIRLVSLEEKTSDTDTQGEPHEMNRSREWSDAPIIQEHQELTATNGRLGPCTLQREEGPSDTLILDFYSPEW